MNVHRSVDHFIVLNITPWNRPFIYHKSKMGTTGWGSPTEKQGISETLHHFVTNDNHFESISSSFILNGNKLRINLTFKDG